MIHGCVCSKITGSVCSPTLASRTLLTTRGCLGATIWHEARIPRSSLDMHCEEGKGCSFEHWISKHLYVHELFMCQHNPAGVPQCLILSRKQSREMPNSL